MKKHTLYIFILIVLIGFFSFTFKTQAQGSSPTINTQTPQVKVTIPPQQLQPLQNLPTNYIACANSNGLAKLICEIQQIINSIIPVLLALGVVYFVWGVVRFMIADGEEAKTKGKDQIIYGVIGFAVIIGLWGLVNIVVSTFGLNSTAAPTGININGTSSTCNLSATNTTFQNFIGYVTCIINDYIIPFIFSLAVVFFVWGVVQSFIINADEESKRAQGKQFIIWGIVAIAVMLSVWGLVGVLSNTFGFNASILPTVKPPGS